MDKIQKRHDEELNRMYDKLNELEPGSEAYEKMLAEIAKATTVRNESKKVGNEKKDLAIKIGTVAAGVLITPMIDYICKRSLAGFIGKVEQMETFTSTPGRSIGSWFKWKN